MKEAIDNRALGKPSRAKGGGRGGINVEKIKCSTCGETFTDVTAWQKHMSACKGKTR